MKSKSFKKVGVALTSCVLAGCLCLTGCGSSNADGTSESSAQEESTEVTSETVDLETIECGDFGATIDNIELSTNADGEEMVDITCTWVNKGDTATAFASVGTIEVIQDSQELSWSIDQDSESSWFDEIQPDETCTFTQSFNLIGDSELDISIIGYDEDYNEITVAKQRFTVGDTQNAVAA